MIAYYCEPCTLYDRRTIKLSDDIPTMPCGKGCRRILWRPRSWYCLRCSLFGNTTIVYSDPKPTAPCPKFPHSHVGQWVETEISRWAFRNIPPPAPDELCATEAT